MTLIKKYPPGVFIPWFAWRPVKIEHCGSVVWLEYVKRHRVKGVHYNYWEYHKYN